ncbi:MAG: lysophospholipid acyltransferase family protein [Verrucomicrobiota bacterium]
MKTTVTQFLVAGTVKVITGIRAVWHGCPPAGARPRVYFANHGSHLDFVALWAALDTPQRLRTRPVAARDFWNAAGIRRWIACSVFRALLINRTKATREDNPLHDMRAVLAGGESLILFPEGTRTLTGETADFKAGLYHLAKAAPEAEFVPVFLENLNRILPKGEMLPIPLLTTVVFGTPLSLQPLEARDAYLARARDAVLGLRHWHRAPEVSADSP